MTREFYNTIRWVIFFVVFGIVHRATAHSVQVAYCANCNGDLRIWVEHWHSTEDINTTTMTLDVIVNGVTTTFTGSPNTGVQDVPFGSLPGCSTPLTLFGSCPSYANTYNDWVAYDFTGMPVGVPITIKIISGNSAFTEDGCGMYPASTGIIIIDPPPAISNATGCSGTNDSIGPFVFAQGNTWTNNNTAIGIPASGTGDIPAFIPPRSNTTQVATITVSNTCGSTSFTITVKPSPVSNFTGPGVPGSSSIACPGLPVTFTELSTPVSGSSITSWTWDFGDGSPPVTAQNPTHTFPLNPSSFVVTLTSTDANGCAPDTSFTVDITGPNAEFTADNVCDSSAVIFTDASSPSSIASWKWDFNNDGSVDNTTQSPSFTYSGPGTYQVELLVEASGCKDSVTHSVVVNPKPVAAFTAAAECLGESTIFNNISSITSGSINVWSWDFNDNSALNTSQSPSHAYAAHGTYNVSLTATSDSGCTDMVTIPVQTYDLPVSVFNFSNPCKYDSVLFINTSLNPSLGSISGWSWNFGDGSPVNTSDLSPKHLYAAPGNYQVTLITQSSNLGCADTLQSTITVFPVPVANFSFSNVCLNQPSNFTDLSSVASGSITGWSWNFGDGSPANTTASPSHTYTLPGSYTVTLIVTTDNGCKDTISKTTVIHALPVANYTTANVCFTVPVNFSDSSSILPTDTLQYRRWDFGDGSPLSSVLNPSHQYAAAGSYTVELLVVSTFGCADSVSTTVTVNPKPVADFTSSSVCSGISTQFTDASITSPGLISTWQWDFGDGSPTNNTSGPSHIYPSAGIKTATLIVNNNFGCSDTVTKPVTVYFNPVAGFTYSNVCSGDSMHFNNTTTLDSSASVSGYLWAFGDSGPNSFLENPVHYYTNPGNYTVTLVVTTLDGCSSAAIVPVNAFDAPQSGFTFANSCLFDNVLFTNTSSPPSTGSIANWSWNFGDGSPSNTSTTNPSHQYTSPGNYVVTLVTYSSNLGCADTLKDTITIYNKPVADFSYTEVCEDQSTSFTDLSSISGGDSVTAWSWDYADGSSFGTVQNPNHTYTAHGTPLVTLIVTTNNGCKDTIATNILVHPAPTVQLYAPNTCLGNITPFNDISTIATNVTNDVIQTRIWNYGDGSPTYNNQNAPHMYSALGTYTIKLVVISTFGCADSTTTTVTISPKPSVQFTSNDTLGCEPLCISFSDGSSIASGTISSYFWNFGDNTTDTTQNPAHCFTTDLIASPEQFDITLTVTSDSGCVTVLSKNNNITAYPKPVANFTITPVEASVTTPDIVVTDATIGASYWHWDFGDGSVQYDTTLASDSISHFYSDTGTYTITLIATSQYECKDTAYQNPIILPDFTFYVPSGFTPNGDGKNDTFCPVGLFIGKFEMTIYDRWGNFVFYTDDVNKCWEGPVNNGSETTLQDIYVYVIKVTDNKKRKYYYRDTISVIR